VGTKWDRDGVQTIDVQAAKPAAQRTPPATPAGHFSCRIG
jgi:hypothetical protein